jgi:hypothetical protein
VKAECVRSQLLAGVSKQCSDKGVANFEILPLGAEYNVVCSVQSGIMAMMRCTAETNGGGQGIRSCDLVTLSPCDPFSFHSFGLPDTIVTYSAEWRSFGSDRDRLTGLVRKTTKPSHPGSFGFGLLSSFGVPYSQTLRKREAPQYGVTTPVWNRPRGRSVLRVDGREPE